MQGKVHARRKMEVVGGDVVVQQHGRLGGMGVGDLPDLGQRGLVVLLQRVVVRLASGRLGSSMTGCSACMTGCSVAMAARLW